MSDMENLQLFENQAIRTAWNEVEEEWYFSVVDVVGALTDQPDIRRAAKYWSVLKNRIKKESKRSITYCLDVKKRPASAGQSSSLFVLSEQYSFALLAAAKTATLTAAKNNQFWAN